jgi:hypothetical protein
VRAIDLVPSPGGYRGADDGESNQTHRPDPPNVARASVFKYGAAVHLNGNGREGGANRRANNQVSHTVIFAFGINTQNVSARKCLPNRRPPQGDSIVVQRLKGALVGFGVVQHDADLLARLQYGEIIPFGACGAEGRPRCSENDQYRCKEQNRLREIHGSTSFNAYACPNRLGGR